MAEILSIRRKTLSQKINQSLSKSINKIEFSFVSVSSCASWYSVCTGSHRYRLRNRSRTAECLVVIRLNSLTLGNVRKCPPVSCLCGFFFSKRGYNDTEIFINKAFKFNIIFSFSSVILNWSMPVYTTKISKIHV